MKDRQNRVNGGMYKIWGINGSFLNDATLNQTSFFDRNMRQTSLIHGTRGQGSQRSPLSLNLPRYLIWKKKNGSSGVPPP